MKFYEAFRLAMRDPVFVKHYDNVVRCMAENSCSECLIFGFKGETDTFYYGFDGIDILEGKHSASRSRVLLKRGEVYLI